MQEATFLTVASLVIPTSALAVAWCELNWALGVMNGERNVTLLQSAALIHFI